jgi:hypothetical protein
VMINIEMGPEFNTTVAKLDSMGRAIFGACSRGLEKGAAFAATIVSRDYLSGQSLKTRTGRLKAAVDGWMEGPLDAVVGVRPNQAVDDYKWLLGDEDKTITPKKAKFLAIPIGEGLTGSGVARFSSPRQVPNGFFIKTKGRLLFGYKKGKTKRAKFRPLFTLVPSVFVQGTGALYDGVMDSLDDIGGAIETEIGKVTEG